MKSIFFILCLVSLKSMASGSGILSSGGEHTCVLDSEGVKCWGNNGDGQLNVPELKNPRLVSAGGYHTCALDDEGVKCWGDNGEGQLTVPELKNPKLVTAGGRHTCALDDKGVKCWGWNRSDQLKIPRGLKKPQLVSASGMHTCALDRNGVKCWGHNGDGQLKVPRGLKKPKLISAGGYNTCALDSEGVKCWGWLGERIPVLPKFKNPKIVSPGGFHACALDDEGVKCWGNNGDGQLTVPELKNPREISAGYYHTCALDDEGVKCWGSDGSGQTSVPKLNFGPSLKAPQFKLSEVSSFLLAISEGSTPARLKLFKNLSSFNSTYLSGPEGTTQMEKFAQNSARYTLAALLAPGILSGDSQYYVEKVIPAYTESMKKIEIELGLFGLNDVLDMPLVRTVALSVIQSTLTVMNEFFSASDRSELLSMNRLLGSALADVTSREKVLAAIDEIESKKELFQKLERSSKTSFLVETLFTAREFLDSKVR